MSNYAVYKVFRDWGKPIQTIVENLSEAQAKKIVDDTPYDDESVVVFNKMK